VLNCAKFGRVNRKFETREGTLSPIHHCLSYFHSPSVPRSSQLVLVGPRPMWNFKIVKDCIFTYNKQKQRLVILESMGLRIR